MICKVIQTGSSGNAVLYHNQVLVDAGTSFKKIRPYLDDLEIVLLTHEHSDHFKESTVRLISRHKPNVKFVAGSFLYDHLIKAKVDKNNILIMKPGEILKYKGFQISPVELFHKNIDMTICPNYGYRIVYKGHKTIHMTDTYTYEGIEAKGYDLYAIEANYDEKKLRKIVREQIRKGEFAHGVRSRQTHASKQQAIRFVKENGKSTSKVIFLHPSELYL